MKNIKNINQEQYLALKAFINYFTDRYSPINLVAPELRPKAFFSRVENISLTQAKNAALMAINDIIEETSNWDQNKIKKLEDELKLEELQSLAELRLQYSKKYQKILKRGYIKTEVEYYLVKGIYDGKPDSLVIDEKQKLTTMLITFEQSKELKGLG